MKKLIAMMLCLTTMLLGSLALAECPNETILPDYNVTVDELPAGYELQTLETELGTYLVASTNSDRDCAYLICVAPCGFLPDYTLTLNDLDEEDNLLDKLDALTEEYFNVSAEYRETANGIPVIVLNSNDAETDFADLATIWHNYFVSVSLLKSSEITEDDLTTGMALLSTLQVIDKATEATPVLAGGWNLNADLDNETLEIFYKAAGDDTELQPMALLGTQVVAGTNYAVLCADAEGWKIAYVYATLDGAASLERVQVLLPVGDQLGAWQIMTPECDDYDTAYEKTSEALDNMLGASYDQQTVLASQMVNGTNYAVLTRKTLVTAEPIANWALVIVHVDLDGNASVIDIQDVGLSLAE